VQKKRTNFAVTLELVCDDCVNAENKLQKEVNYLSAKLSNLTIDNLEEAKVKKALKRKLANKRKQLTSCANNELRTIRHSRNSRFVNNKKKGREPALSYNLNIRAMLMAFYCGTGGFDIGSFASFMGISGGGSWERTFHRKSGVIHDVILDLCDTILAESLKAEVVATIRHELGTKYELDTINRHINAYFLGKYGGFTPWLPRVFRSFLNHVSKSILYVRRDSYVATTPKTISFPPSHGDVHFKYSFAFKKLSRKIVDCYRTYAFY